MSNVKERPKRIIKRPTYLGYEYLMDDNKFDDDIEIIEDISAAPFQKPQAYEQIPLQNYQPQPQPQLPHLSDEDLEILELPPKPVVLGDEASAPPPCYYPSGNLFDAFAPAAPHVNHVVDDDVMSSSTPINPYHELVAENAAAAVSHPFERHVVSSKQQQQQNGGSHPFERHVICSYEGANYKHTPTLTPSDRGGICPSIASCSPTSSLSSNGFASPEEFENGGFINPPDSSCSPLNDSSATKSSSKMAATGRRSDRPFKMAASLKNVSSSSGNASKKKKRDPNEPQKPVSAYALFFRDTQAAIKGQNPTATFGEVSKIVASMWDSLDNTRKEVYKKKTETAKKDYTKKLSEYRAKIAAKGQKEGVSAWGVSPSSPPPDVAARISAETAYIERYYESEKNPPSSGKNNESENYCERVGCGRVAVENEEWGDDRYCSEGCVVGHCKDVFNAWVSARQTSNVLEHSLPVQRTSVV